MRGGENIIFRRGEGINIIFGPKYRPLQQPEIHPLMSVPHMFRKLCHIFLSVSISVTICFLKALAFWLLEQICKQLDPDRIFHADPDPGGKPLRVHTGPKHC
jgi:hypothetical protein